MSIIAVIHSTLMTVAFALKEATARQAHVAPKINLIAILPFLFLYSYKRQYDDKINYTKKHSILMWKLKYQTNTIT